MISMSDALHLIFLSVAVKSLANVFQELVHTLHPATCCTSTKVQPNLKLFHLPYHPGLMFCI